jgi:hypothetical protein
MGCAYLNSTGRQITIEAICQSGSPVNMPGTARMIGLPVSEISEVSENPTPLLETSPPSPPIQEA